MSGLVLQPVDCYLQLADLLVEAVALCLPACLASPEHLGQRPQDLLLSGADLADMHLVLRGQPDRRLLPLDRLQPHPRTELFAVPFTLHLRPFCLCHSILRGCLKSGGHFIHTIWTTERTQPGAIGDDTATDCT